MSLHWSLSLGVAWTTVKNEHIRNEKKLRRVRRMIRGTQYSYPSILQLGKEVYGEECDRCMKAVNIIETIKREQLLAVFHVIRTITLSEAIGLKQARGNTSSQRYAKITVLFHKGYFANLSTKVFQKYLVKFME